MRLSSLVFAVSATFVNANPRSGDSGPSYTHFASREIQDVNLRYVLNSGVCETTPGVQQMSGYIDVDKNMSMWFWLIEARYKPENAPLTLWLNGGPGCSSMMGLFVEHGPCTVNHDGKDTTLNPFSWNNISNMLYLDQPVGVGLSRGTGNVNSTPAAAPAVWKAIQVLFESKAFSMYKDQEFILATESYGGQYVPAFVTYFNEQNALIRKEKLRGELINVYAVMINNGWLDPRLQYQSYVHFLTDAPGYGPLQNDTVISQITNAFFKTHGCKDKLSACYEAVNTTKSNKICIDANYHCVENVYLPAMGDLDPYDLMQNHSTATFPSTIFVKFLNDPEVVKKIGAESTFLECSDKVYHQFKSTGDEARSLLHELGQLANLGLRLLIWAGDLDIDCNWLGGYASVLAMDWYGGLALNNTPFTNMTIGGSENVVAAYKNVDNVSFARVDDAGHQLTAYQPEVSLAIFRQVVNKEQLHSVP